jgi:hypothetical protein
LKKKFWRIDFREGEGKEEIVFVIKGHFNAADALVHA